MLLCGLAALAAPFSATAQTAANPPDPTLETMPAIVLMLPAESTPFGRAATAVREGFFAAHAAAGAPVAIQVEEIEETPARVAAVIGAARARGARLIVGPLTRDAVDALARAGGAALPVLALNLPSSGVALPPSMRALGLAVDEEARSAVRRLLRELAPGFTPDDASAYAVVTGAGGLERRIGDAFAEALREAGERVQRVPFTLKGAALAETGKRLAERRWRAILLALSAGEAAALRPWLPADVPAVGTSRLNLTDASAAGLVQDLEGVHFVDMPWLVEPDHPAVMVYPRAATPYTAELERLYALGIDAYRVAAEWMQGRERFELDGVTGWLRADPAQRGRIERMPVLAVFANGKVERRDVLR